MAVLRNILWEAAAVSTGLESRSCIRQRLYIKMEASSSRLITRARSRSFDRIALGRRERARSGIGLPSSAREGHQVAPTQLLERPSPRRPASAACMMAEPLRHRMSPPPIAFYPGVRALRVHRTSTAATAHNKAKTPAGVYRHTNHSSGRRHVPIQIYAPMLPQ